MNTNRGPIRRRGAVANVVLLTIGAMVTVGVSIVVVTPRVIEANAAEGAARDVAAANPANQEVIEQLGRLIAHSSAVLFVHDQADSPYREVLLWMADAENPGEIDARELALLSFSSTLQAVTIHTWEPEEPSTDLVEPPPTPTIQSVAAVSNLEFCDRWRTHEGVRRRVIANRVESLRFDQLEGYRPLSGLWRITLTWAAESADQSDTASVTVTIGARD